MPPFHFTYFCLLLPLCPRGVCVCVSGRGGEGRGGEGRPAGRPERSRAAAAALAAFDVSFECRSLAPLLAPSICSAGGAGRPPLKGHCRQPPRLAAERRAPRNFAAPEAAAAPAALRPRSGPGSAVAVPLPAAPRLLCNGDFGDGGGGGGDRRGKSSAVGTELPLIGAEGVIYFYYFIFF